MQRQGKAADSTLGQERPDPVADLLLVVQGLALCRNGLEPLEPHRVLRRRPPEGIGDLDSAPSGRESAHERGDQRERNVSGRRKRVTQCGHAAKHGSRGGDQGQAEDRGAEPPPAQPSEADARAASEQKINQNYMACMRAKPKFECDQTRTKALAVLDKPKTQKRQQRKAAAAAAEPEAQR